MKIKAIGFDLDGTLYPYTPEIHKRVRNKIYEKISKFYNIPENKAEELFEKAYLETSSGHRSIERISEVYEKEIGKRDLIQEALEEADILDMINPNPALRNMLTRLSQTKSLDIITGSEFELARKKLTKIGIPENTFEYFLSLNNGSKTTGGKYLKWIQLRELNPKQLLYIGDNNKQDVDAPKSLGIKTCIIGKYENADFQISNILDLENILNKTH